MYAVSAISMQTYANDSVVFTSRLNPILLSAQQSMLVTNTQSKSVKKRPLGKNREEAVVTILAGKKMLVFSHKLYFNPTANDFTHSLQYLVC